MKFGSLIGPKHSGSSTAQETWKLKGCDYVVQDAAEIVN
jgi:hypothetical protein